MCDIISGIFHKKDGIKQYLFMPSHSDIIEYCGYKDNKITPDFVKYEITPPEKLQGFWDARNWRFVIDQDIIPDWFDRKFVESEVRKAVQKELDACPEPKNGDILDGRFLAVKGNAEIRLAEYCVVLFLPDKTTIKHACHATIQYAGNATIQYAGYATIKDAGCATIEDAGYATIKKAGNATIKDAGYATIKDAGYATIQYAGYATIQYADHATIQYVGCATIEDAGYATIEDAGYATIKKAGYATIQYADHATIQYVGCATIAGVKYCAGKKEADDA